MDEKEFESMKLINAQFGWHYWCVECGEVCIISQNVIDYFVCKKISKPKGKCFGCDRITKKFLDIRQSRIRELIANEE